MSLPPVTNSALASQGGLATPETPPLPWIYNALLPVMERVLGPKHPDTLIAWHYLAGAAGILVARPACVTLAVTGPGRTAVKVTVPILVSQC